MSSPRWALVIPVKDFTQAKSRLVGPVGEAVPGLAEALAADAIAVAVASVSVECCLVVADEGTARWAMKFGASPVVEPIRGGLNAALASGRDAALDLGFQSVAFMMADLPLVSAQHLDRFLELVPPVRPGVVGDVEGTGTTVLAARSGEQLNPEFGVDSLARHRRQAVDLSDHCDFALRVDLDTWDELLALPHPTGRLTRSWIQQNSPNRPRVGQRRDCWPSRTNRFLDGSVARVT